MKSVCLVLLAVVTFCVVDTDAQRNNVMIRRLHNNNNNNNNNNTTTTLIRRLHNKVDNLTDLVDEEFDDPFRQGCGCKRPRNFCQGQCQGGHKCKGRCVRPPLGEFVTAEPTEVVTYGPELQEFESAPKDLLGCQNYVNMPTMDGGKFTCAAIFKDKGGPYSVDSCNGIFHYYVTDGEKKAGRERYYYPMGTMLIKPGCKLYMFYDVNFGGASRVETGNVFHNQWGHSNHAPSLGNGPQSYMCSCEQEPISCTPTDGWEPVVYCDNKEGQGPATCSYSVTIGTSYSESATKSMSISRSVSVSIQAGLDEIFAADVSGTLTLGFDWSKTSSLTKDKSTTVDVTEDVEPGKVLLIEQAVGHCGGNKISTNLFKFTEQDSSVGGYWNDTTTTTRTIEKTF